MASSFSSTSRTLRLQARSAGDVHNLPDYDYDKPSHCNELCGILGILGGGSLAVEIAWTKLTKCNFFEWINDELEDGYYKTLIYSKK
ncbi:hypothetical protein Lser_V15G32233 [Lactuca serriola]